MAKKPKFRYGRSLKRPTTPKRKETRKRANRSSIQERIENERKAKGLARPKEPEVLATPGQEGEYTGDLALVKRAIESRWPIPENLKGMLIRKLVRIGALGQKDRDRVAAIRAVMAADALNAQREAAALKAPQNHLHLHNEQKVQNNVVVYIPDNSRDTPQLPQNGESQ